MKARRLCPYWYPRVEALEKRLPTGTLILGALGLAGIEALGETSALGAGAFEAATAPAKLREAGALVRADSACAKTFKYDVAERCAAPSSLAARMETDTVFGSLADTFAMNLEMFNASKSAPGTFRRGG